MLYYVSSETDIQIIEAETPHDAASKFSGHDSVTENCPPKSHDDYIMPICVNRALDVFGENLEAAVKVNNQEYHDYFAFEDFGQLEDWWFRLDLVI